jgi:hypothetical protein
MRHLTDYQLEKLAEEGPSRLARIGRGMVAVGGTALAAALARAPIARGLAAAGKRISSSNVAKGFGGRSPIVARAASKAGDLATRGGQKLTSDAAENAGAAGAFLGGQVATVGAFGVGADYLTGGRKKK